MKGKVQFWSMVVVFLMFFGARPNSIQASIIISEVAPAPGAGPEWLEVVNTGDQAVDLTGFYLEDVLTSPTVIKTFATGDQILPGQIQLLELETTKLNNSGDGVVLKNSTSNIIDNVIFGSTETGLSWHRPIDINQPMTIGAPTPLQISWWPPPGLSPTPTDSSPTSTPTPGTTVTPPVASSSATPQPTVTPTDRKSVV